MRGHSQPAVLLTERRRALRDPSDASNDPRDLLRRVPFFAALSDSALDQLISESWIRRFPAGQILTTEGDPGDSLIVIERGVARVVRWGPSGQEIVLATVRAPQAIGELALIDGAPRSATIIVQEPVVVRVVPRRVFLDLVAHDPETAQRVMQTLATMVRATNERLTDILTLDVPGRVAKWLLRSRATDETPASVPFQISQADLASELGTTRVSINKALKMFENLGAIRIEPKAIVIVDPSALENRVN